MFFDCFLGANLLSHIFYLGGTCTTSEITRSDDICCRFGDSDRTQFGASYTTPQTSSVPNVSSFQSGVPSNGVVATGVHQAVSQNAVHCISQGVPKSVAQPVLQSMPQGVYQTMLQAQSINAAVPATGVLIYMGAPMTISGCDDRCTVPTRVHVREARAGVGVQSYTVR